MLHKKTEYIQPEEPGVAIVPETTGAILVVGTCIISNFAI